MNNNELFINKILDRINEAAEKNQGLTLTHAEVKELSKELGDQIFIPILSMEEAAEMARNGDFKGVEAD